MAATSTTKPLPERVQRGIRRQDDDSERLIGWIQLAVVVFFGILYAVSPKVFTQRQTFFLVPGVEEPLDLVVVAP